MSLRVFITDLQKKPLTAEYLKSVWEFCNLKNKSQYIDLLSKALMIEITKRAKKLSIEQNVVSFSPEETKRMCTKFQDEIIKRNIPPTVPHLEQLSAGLSIGHETWRYNPATNIIFRPRGNTQSSIVSSSIPSQKEDKLPMEGNGNMSTTTGKVSPNADSQSWIAVRVISGNKMYPLMMKHLSICISNGWYFETDIPNISSPFKVGGEK